MTQRLLIVRHTESECSRSSILNGDPSLPCPLSGYGRDQARELGERLAGMAIELCFVILAGLAIELCFVTQFERTQETAELALAGTGVPVIEEPLLNDPPLGDFEGTSYEAHDRWMEARDWYAKPPGGENQLEALARYVRGFERVLDATAGTVLVIGHHFPISFALTAAWDEGPAVRRRYRRKIAPGEMHEVDPAALRTGVGRAAAELGPLGYPIEG